MTLPNQRYIASEVIHFVGRGMQNEEQYHLLLKILKEGWITHPPHYPNFSGNLLVNISTPFSSNEMYIPQCVCFCDIPFVDLSIHIAKYSSFGLSFSKDFIIQKGGCPVFYIPLQSNVNVSKDFSTYKPMPSDQEEDLDLLLENISKKELFARLKEKYSYVDIPIKDYFDRMIGEYIALMELFKKMIKENCNTPGVPNESIRLRELMKFIDFHIFSFIKFYDHTYVDDHEYNYYMEREWRVIGNLEFSLKDINTIFIPKSFAQQFRADFPSYNAQMIFI